jgi:Protein of unknown function (DUF559)
VTRPQPLPAALTPAAFSVADAEALGVPRGRLFRSDLARPYRGVRTTAPPMTVAERCAAYLPNLRDGHFFSHGTSAVLHDMPLPRAVAEDRQLHVSAFRPAQRVRAVGVVGHRLEPRLGAIEVRGGFPMTTAVETWCLLGGVLGVEALVVAGDHLIRRGVPNPEAVLADLRNAFDGVRRLGSERLQRALALLRPGVRSPRESLLRVLLVLAGLPEPAINVRLFAGGRYLGEGDLVYRSARLVLEYEGDHHRTDAEQWRADIRRRERFEDAGWSVLRVTSDDVFRHRNELIARVRTRLAR